MTLQLMHANFQYTLHDYTLENVLKINMYKLPMHTSWLSFGKLLYN